MIKRRRFPKIFPGWWILLTGMWLNLWGAGYSLWAFSATFKLMASDLGFSRAVTAAASSIRAIGQGFAAPVIGWVTDRFGPRRIILFGVLLFGLGLILMYFVNSLWTFYLVWGVIVGTGATAASGVAMNTAITNWFVKKRGLALGMRMMFSGTLVLPLINWLITTQGWRMTWVVGGVVTWVVGLPLTWLCIRDQRPEYYGLLPDGATVEEGLKGDTGQMIKKGVEYAAEVQEVEFTLRQAMRTPAYWLLIVASIGPNISAFAVPVHLIPLLTDIGMSPTKASASVAIVGLFNPVLRFVSGLLTDRVKKEHLRLLLGGAYFLQAAGVALFVLNQTIAMVYPFLILFFVCLAVNMVALPSIEGRYFGRKAIGSIRGSLLMFAMPLEILAPIYLGWVYDKTGSYITALFVLAILLALSAVFMFLARPPKPPAQITDIHKIV